MATKVKTATPLRPSSFPLGLEFIGYVLRPSRDKFKLDAWHKHFRGLAGADKTSLEFEKDTTYAVIVPSKEGKSGTYHVHSDWSQYDDTIEIHVYYYPGALKHAPTATESEPFAEDFMQWLGTFFKYDTAQATVTASFSYPLSERQSRFPLPMKLDLGTEAEIDGISLRLSGKPEGVVGVRLLQGRTKWFADVMGETRVAFKSFSPYDGATAIAHVLLTTILVEERTP